MNLLDYTPLPVASMSDLSLADLRYLREQGAVTKSYMHLEPYPALRYLREQGAVTKSYMHLEPYPALRFTPLLYFFNSNGDEIGYVSGVGFAALRRFNPPRVWHDTFKQSLVLQEIQPWEWDRLITS